MTNLAEQLAARLNVLGVSGADAVVKSLETDGRYVNLKDGEPFEYVGTVSGAPWDRLNQFGNMDKGLAIDLGDGDKIKITSFAKAWHTEVERENPKDGDVVVVVYRGKVQPTDPTKKPYHSVSLRVAKRAGVDNGEAPF